MPECNISLNKPYINLLKTGQNPLNMQCSEARVLCFCFQCVALQANVLNLTKQLEKCQEESSKKDQTITELTQHIQKLETELRTLKAPPPQHIKKKTNIQSSVKVVISSQALLGNIYDLKLNFEHPDNQIITEKVQTDFRDIKSEYSEKEIDSACKTYFSSMKKAEQRKSSGYDDKHRTICRSGGRKRRKLNERQQAVSDPRVDLTPEERELAQSMVELGMDGVSSEEDDEPADHHKHTPKIRRVKKFYWRSERCDQIRDKLDSGYLEHLTKATHKNRRSTLIRDSTCPVSDRKPPVNADPWILKSNDSTCQ